MPSPRPCCLPFAFRVSDHVFALAVASFFSAAICVFPPFEFCAPDRRLPSPCAGCPQKAVLDVPVDEHFMSHAPPERPVFRAPASPYPPGFSCLSANLL